MKGQQSRFRPSNARVMASCSSCEHQPPPVHCSSRGKCPSSSRRPKASILSCDQHKDDLQGISFDERFITVSPLAAAVSCGSCGAALYLLGRPEVDAALVNDVLDVFCRSKPLLALATSPEKIHPAVVEKLLERGADPRIRDGEDCSAVFYACVTGDLGVIRPVVRALERLEGRPARELLEEQERSGQRVLPRFAAALFDNRIGPTAELMAYLHEEVGLDLTRSDLVISSAASPLAVQELTPLYTLAMVGALQAVSYLVETAGPPVDERGAGGQTALHIACVVPVGKEDRFLALVTYLVEQAGADVTPRDLRGMTPAEVARTAGAMRIHAYLEGKLREQEQEREREREREQERE